jgi:ectoine hydroxylase-related dioxygenase (phytanoyl-CoA dioxygenase family)
MSVKSYYREILKNVYYKTFFKTNIIEESEPAFQSASFISQTHQLEDEFIKHHSLEIIEKGYTVVKSSVPNELIDNAVNEFYDWKARNKYKFLPSFFKFEEKMDRIINLQSKLKIFNKCFVSNKALQVQDYLFGSETTLYTSLFFEVGSAQNIHRDIPLFWTNPPNMYFGTWLALEKTDFENGPLVVIPGSHKLPLFDRAEIMEKAGYANKKIDPLEEKLWNAYQEHVYSQCKINSLKLEEVYVEKGDTIIWHPLLAHGGKEILDKKRTRLSHVVHTTPYNTPVFHMDVFFNKKAKVPINAPWKYEKFEGRNVVKHKNVSIKHLDNYNYGLLN